MAVKTSFSGKFIRLDLEGPEGWTMGGVDEPVIVECWRPDNPNPARPERCLCGATKDDPCCYCSC